METHATHKYEQSTMLAAAQQCAQVQSIQCFCTLLSCDKQGAGMGQRIDSYKMHFNVRQIDA